jgi:hypothetical protein
MLRGDKREPYPDSTWAKATLDSIFRANIPAANFLSVTL